MPDKEKYQAAIAAAIEGIKFGKLHLELQVFQGVVSNINVEKPVISNKFKDTGDAVAWLLEELKGRQDASESGILSLNVVFKSGEITHITTQDLDQWNYKKGT